MNKEELLYDRKELSRALNFAIMGIIGFIIPLFGLIFGLIALAKISMIDNNSEKIINKKQKVRIAGIAAVTLSIIMIGVYGLSYYVIHQNNIETMKNQEAAKQKEQEEANRQATEAQIRLSSCLEDAEEAHRKNWEADVQYLGRTDNRLPAEYAERLETRLKETKEECYRSAEAGILQPRWVDELNNN